MLPNQLVAESFSGYPAQAKRLVVSQLPLLRGLPLAFVPLLLRELIVYDWKFPAERRDLERQFAWLHSLSPGEMAKAVAPFSRLTLSDSLEKTDWVNQPAIFTEQLTAHLWKTHQIDAFRAGAVEYVAAYSGTAPEGPLPAHRLGIAVIGKGVQTNEYRLFRKLRPHGVYYSQVRHEDGLNTLVEAVKQRAESFPLPYGHWYIDGENSAAMPSGVTHVSYAALSPVRASLQNLMQKIYEASVFDPEAFRTRMAQTRPEEIGLNTAADGVLSRFELSLLTEGSGTQVFSTTFVQWAAREALRRAQPVTLLARFTPRQRENSMDELLSEARRPPELDPQGSLIDADMGAYYSWLNQQRLSGADNAGFLVWFENQSEAVAIGPGFARGKHSDAPVELKDLLAQLA
ncbi:MAG TPA: hypothetical protein VN519_05180 [Bryobacteraceae bacterium]|nr:hypothetical protein [Bryobacteraceae bacterium]